MGVQGWNDDDDDYTQSSFNKKKLQFELIEHESFHAFLPANTRNAALYWVLDFAPVFYTRNGTMDSILV